MAGNFMRDAADDASFGSKNAEDLPVDSPELIALYAPRLVFVSYGIPENGDAKWLDQQGSFMATVAAQPVFELLGDETLGVPSDYQAAKMPPVNSGLLDGQLAWRQHDGGTPTYRTLDTSFSGQTSSCSALHQGDRGRMKRLRYSILPLILASSLNALASPPPTWVGTWAASQQIPESQNSLSQEALKDATLRQTVHVSCGGSMIRVHLSNAFGTRALHLTSVHIARPVASGSSAIDPSTDRALLFNGVSDVLIPPAAEYISDPISFPLVALSDFTVSIHVEAEPGQQTGHPGSRQTSFYAPGDLTTAADMLSAIKVDHWYLLSGVDVQGPPSAYSIVVLGDSITDGHGATTNRNNRWTDVLARRLQADPRRRNTGVLNQGIGGNHLLTDGLGPNALARLDRDVLAQPGVQYVIVLEGINDLGGLEREASPPKTSHDDLVHRMIGAYQQIVTRAHARGVRVYGATVMPDGGSDYYHPGLASEEDRQRVNAWIRQPGSFDAVIDFDRVMADPDNPRQLLPAYDSGDHLHPGPAGYRAMGDAIDLALFK
ncbi:lysophospholipase L1-like esterase [Granulicella aggregans]|uniref:Lysophospholipase L1-like esterase n=1 Tax=Granulicella aggregans TaxID=474949 RepID=A0A7W8E5C1_9BACT|nr:SGNH/GDSL hydrolase family protein [Granulicella aggregans]MBB5058055.1 lysophospholipase L1-like esterase [Granulicella aggregans]